MKLAEKSTDLFLKFGLFAVLGLFVYSCFGRDIHVDDAWLGAQSMWLAKDGVIKSEALRGWEGADIQIFFTHKIFIVLGALFVKLFGYSAYVLKSVSAFYLIALLISWKFIIQKFSLTRRYALLFSLLLLVNAIVFEYGFIFRPEVALAFYALWVYYFVYRYEQSQKYLYLVWAGLCGAIAIGHHLNGIMIAGAGCLVLLLSKRIKGFLLFGVICSLGFLAFLVDLRSVADFHQMLAQFSNTQDMRGERGVAHYLFSLLDEQRRYFHSPIEISLSLLALSTIVPFYKSLYARYKSLIQFLFGMMFWLALLSHGKTSKYLILFLPFILFLVTVALLEVKGRLRNFALVVLLLYGAINLSFDVILALKKDHRFSVYDQLAGDLPAGTKILAPMDAVFWAWERYNFQAIEVYEIYQLKGDLEEGSPTHLEWLKKYGTQVILFPQPMLKSFGVGGEVYGPYVYKAENTKNHIYRYDYRGE